MVKSCVLFSRCTWCSSTDTPGALQDSVLPPDVKARVSVEAASTFGWLKYVGFEGISLGVNQFGQSAPAPTIYEKLGITVDGAVKAVKSLL